MKKLPFVVQLLIALLSLVLSVVGVAYYLDSYTHHGKTAKVPKVSGLPMDAAIKSLKDAGFDYTIDSTYRDSLPKLQVLKQYPQAGDQVKEGRTVQLIVNKSVPPQIAMPALVGVRLSSAIQYLDRNSLKLADTIFKPDFATGRILQQLVNGKEIAPGTLISFGTPVTLVVSSGLGNVIYNYPDFYGKTLAEAYVTMEQLGLSRGALSKDASVKDSSKAIIYKQYPEPWDYYNNRPTLIRQGNTVDLFISATQKPRELPDTSATSVGIDEFDNAAKAEQENLDYETGRLIQMHLKRKKESRNQNRKRLRQQRLPKPNTGDDY